VDGGCRRPRCSSGKPPRPRLIAERAYDSDPLEAATPRP
jgi:hypothetical protein